MAATASDAPSAYLGAMGVNVANFELAFLAERGACELEKLYARIAVVERLGRLPRAPAEMPAPRRQADRR